jgi:hypothetical protein
MTEKMGGSDSPNSIESHIGHRTNGQVCDDSLCARYGRATLTHLNRRRREADIDYMLKLKWARSGFVSIPGNLGPVDGDGGSDD